MDTLKSRKANQRPLPGVTDVVEGEGAEKWDGVAHDKHYHQQLKYSLSQVNLKRQNNALIRS